MNSKRMLKTLRYLRGHTISKVRQNKNGTHVCLHFENGSFCVFSADTYSDSSELVLCKDLGHLNHWDKGELGIISIEEFEKLKAQREANDAEMKANNDAISLRRRHEQECHNE